MRESTRYIMVVGTTEIGNVALYTTVNTNDFIIVDGKLYQILGVRRIVNHDTKVMQLSCAYENPKY